MNPDFQTPLPKWISKTAPIKLISNIYLSIIRYRNSYFDKNSSVCYKSKFPVISIGGIRAGGTGKTPLTQHIAQHLSTSGHNVAFLSRGYKRESKKDIIIYPHENAQWETIGDEPAMLHANLIQSYIAVSAKRVLSAKKIEQLAPSDTVILLDDGFQHRKLKRDLDIICVNETILHEKMLPAGFLREPIESLNRAQVLVITGSSERMSFLRDTSMQLSKKFKDIPNFIVTQEVDCWVNAVTGDRSQILPLKKPVAFCGIARPHRFFDLLQTQRIEPVKKIIFPDHHKFTHYDIDNIQKLYSDGLVTTEKDAFRLLNNNFVPGLKLWYLKIKLRFETETLLNRFNNLIDTIAINS